jgi:hypothetical protein
MIKKTNSNYCFSLAFFSSRTFAQSKKKEKTDKESSIKVKLKVLTPKKEQNRIKVIDSTAVTQRGLIDVHKIDNKYLFEIPILF